MKSKLITIIGGVMVLSLLAMGIASAFTVGSVDGIWGNIDGVVTGSQEYSVDIIGYADNGTRAPTQIDQRYILQSAICSPKQNINPTWPDASRWSSETLVWTGLGSHTSTCTNAPDLFFSEYIYDSRTGDDYLGIEIANRTGAAVNLDNYDVYFSTGDRTQNIVNLNNVTLSNGDVYVLVSDDATGQTAQEDQSFTYSDDDFRTVVLVKDTGTTTEGARCDRWATGPGNSPTVYSDWNPAVQTGSTTDENQVRYGRDAFNPTDWSSYTCELTNFAQQSGFGFDGRNDPISPAALTPFFLGEFFHYNNQVFSTDNRYANANPFGFVDLTVTVPVLCNDGSTPTPSSFTIVPRFTLDETSNLAGTCIYGEDGDVPCPDKVTIEFPTTDNPTFVCPDGTYTVNILGFTETGMGDDACWESFNEDAVSSAYITQEDQNNEACLWARIEQPLADISVAKTCWQFDTQDPYYVITTSNLGPGFARSVTLTDTLPDGVTYASHTSQLISTSGTINQGTCTVTGKTINCSLGTPLLDYTTDPLAKWVVRINVNLATGSVINTATVSSITTDPNLANNTATANCSVTGVTLISFDAVSEPEGILLSWETASEVDNLGFNIYKADDPEADKIKVNPMMIPSKAMGSTFGAVYEYLDEDGEIGNRFFYWLEAVDFALTKTLYGPISPE